VVGKILIICPQVAILDLSYTTINGNEAKQIVDNPSLKTLYLSCNNLI
jgi:hypothetical protein